MSIHKGLSRGRVVWNAHDNFYSAKSHKDLSPTQKEATMRTTTFIRPNPTKPRPPRKKRQPDPETAHGQGALGAARDARLDA
eukprot:2750533-Prymnesium_polylepis.1